MVEMLKRFEEGAAEDEGWLEQLREDEQEDELAAALEGIDIGESVAPLVDMTGRADLSRRNGLKRAVPSLTAGSSRSVPGCYARPGVRGG